MDSYSHDIIRELRKKEFNTTDVVFTINQRKELQEEYIKLSNEYGSYNKLNAQIGRYLENQKEKLGICKNGEKEVTITNTGRKSRNQKWRKIILFLPFLLFLTSISAYSQETRYLETNNGLKLEYKVLKMGKGVKPEGYEKVKVNYSYKLLDGTVLESFSSEEFYLEDVEDFIELLLIMPVGSRFLFYLPSIIAETNEPAETIILDIEFLEIKGGSNDFETQIGEANVQKTKTRDDYSFMEWLQLSQEEKDKIIAQEEIVKNQQDAGRKQALTNKYGAATAEKIMAGKYEIGMSKAVVEEILGVNKFYYKESIIGKSVFWDFDYNAEALRAFTFEVKQNLKAKCPTLVFKDGKLTDIIR